MNINIVGDGSAGKRHARLLGERGHLCFIYGPDKASPIQHGPCDAVVIASPPDTHKLYLSWYWDKHPLVPILCEGPVTWMGKENFGRKFGSPCMTASNWRFVPQVQAIKTKMQGHCVHANFWFDYDLAKWRPDIDYRTSCYYTSGIDLINLHSVDLAFYFFGPAKEIHVVKQQTGKSLGYDAVGLLIHHQSGTISTVNSSWHAAQFQFGFRMVMADGSYEEAGWTSPKDDSVANTSYAAMIDAWLNAINRDDTQQVSPSLLDGYRAYKALQEEIV